MADVGSLAVASFALIVLVAAAYYLGSRILSPRPREQGEAVRPYACGERGEPLESAALPYPWAVLLFAAVEAVPVVALASGQRLAAALLLATAAAGVLAAAPDALADKGREG